jgi:hypothetical protein
LDHLETYMKNYRQMTNPLELLPRQRFLALESWALGLEKIAQPLEAAELLTAAPENIEAHLVWTLWRNLGLTAFLKNNVAMDLVERRAWVLASEIYHATSATHPSKIFTKSDVQEFLQEVQKQKQKLESKPLPKIFRFCFHPLQKARQSRLNSLSGASQAPAF